MTGISRATLLSGLLITGVVAGGQAAGAGQQRTEAAPSAPNIITRYSDSSRLGRPHAKDPSVIRFKGSYFMYYSIPPRPGDASGKEGFGTGWAIGVARSSDLRNWRKIGEVLPVQEVERNGIAAPGAVVLNGRVHLFYQTYGNGRRDAINHAVSRDGLTFERDRSNPVFRPETALWSAGRAIDAEPFAYKGRLFLYYATRDPDMKIQMLGVAAAPLASGFHRADWRNLSITGPILRPVLDWEKNCIEAPSVVRRGRTLFMFYAGGYNNEPQQIGVARSLDGIHWQRIALMPFVPNGTAGSWNSSESGHPGIYSENARTILFFQGNSDQGKTWSIAGVNVGWSDHGPYLK